MRTPKEEREIQLGGYTYDEMGRTLQQEGHMKEILSAVPVLKRLTGENPDTIRQHILLGIGDVGKYCFYADKRKTGKKNHRYYIMRADLPKVLHRELTPEETQMI